MKTNINLTRKEMFSFYRKALTKLLALNLKNISYNAELRVDTAASYFAIIVFDPWSNNKSFVFYPSVEIEKHKINLDKLIKVLKKDDFTKVIEFEEIGGF